MPPFPVQTQRGLPIEPNAVISDTLRKRKGDVVLLNALDYMSSLVRMNGWRCDSVSAVRPYIFSSKDGYVLTCNHFKYGYDIEDKGGNWTATLE